MANEKILDAGMVLPGAPKDRAKSLLNEFDIDKLVVNIYDSIGFSEIPQHPLNYDDVDSRSKMLLEDWQKNLSKAKVWPSPSFVDLLESGVPYPVVRGLREVYDCMPSGPVFPVPGELSTLTDLLLTAKPFEDRLREIWAPWVERCANEEPTYRRVMQHWAAFYSAHQVGYGRNQDQLDRVEAFYGNAPDDEHRLLIECCKQTDIAASEILTSVHEKLASYAKLYMGVGLQQKEYKRFGSLRDSNRIFNSLVGDPLPSEGVRDISQLQSNRSAWEFGNIARSLPSDLSEHKTDQQVESLTRMLFNRAFKALKNKPRLLAPKTSEVPSVADAGENKAPPLPKRPIRLNEEETRSLLNEVDNDELHSNPFYQSFEPLVEAGIIRGAQIGNWVPQKERPALVRKNYDAIISLSKTLGITPSLIGLGNPVPLEAQESNNDGLIEDQYSGDQALGFAFGARGKSSAAAHFEPGLFVINLTRKKGAGSLAHEWSHGLDYRLGSLLDYKNINARYHPTDVKRITLSDRIQYFSEYAAMFWFFETHKQASFSSKRNQEMNHRMHIERGLSDDIELSPEQRKHVVNLMLGVSYLIRDAYHVEKSPHEIKAQLLNTTSRCFRAYPEVGANALNKLVDFSLKAASDDEDLAQNLLSWHREAQDFLSNPELDPFDTNSYLDGSIQAIDLQFKLPRVITDKLSREARRDFSEEDHHKITHTVREFIESSIQLVAVETVAERLLINNMMPPHPDPDEHKRRMAGGWQAATREALKEAPLPFLKKLTSLSDRYRYGKTIFDQSIQPTEMARAAGIRETVLEKDDHAADFVALLEKSIGHIVHIPKELGLFYQYQLIENGLSTPEKNQISSIASDIGAGIAQLHQGIFRIPDMLDALQAENGQHPLHKDLSRAYSFIDPETQERSFLPGYEDLSQRELFDALMQETDPRPFQLLALSPARFLPMALLDMHVKSEFHDGTWSSLAETFKDPARLKPFPPGLMTYLSDFEERLGTPPSQAPTSDDDWTAIFDALPSRLLHHGLTNLLSTAALSHLIDAEAGGYSKTTIAQADFMANAFRNALLSDDFSGLEAYDREAQSRALVSFRYHDNDRNIALLTSFFPVADQGFVSQNLSPEKVIAHFYGEIPQSGPASYSSGENYSESEKQIHRESGIMAALSGYNGLIADSIEKQTARFQDMSRQRIANDIRYEATSIERGGHFNASLLQFSMSPFVRLSAQFDNRRISENGSTQVGKARYWSKTIEIFARLSEKVIFERLAESGEPDPFLVTTPTRQAQNAVIRSIKDVETDNYTKPGKFYELCYPAADDLNRMMTTFDEHVVPSLEPALNALFPDSIPHYQRYLENQANQVEERPNQLARREDTRENTLDVNDESTWRSSDGQADRQESQHQAPASNKSSHNDFILSPSSGPGL